MPAEDHFGQEVADEYDDAVSDMFTPAVVNPTASLLSELSDGGRVLEFGIGTGRIAIPLSRRGIRVHGIDLSPFMLERLSAKTGSGDIPVQLGDFSEVRAEGSFSLVYVVFNTIMNLTTQDSQVACFRNAARHLNPGGRFVVEVAVPDLRHLPLGESVRMFRTGPDHWGYDEYDVAQQKVISHHLHVDSGRARRWSIPFRYVWPSELDLMAEMAGLRLEQRWGGWKRELFTSESKSHVSVWRLPRV